VLHELSLSVRPRVITAVLGANGSGKSTALRVLHGLLRPERGRVVHGDRDITAIPPHERLALGIALLPQGRSIFPALTVRENLELGGWLLRRDRARMLAGIERTYHRYPALKGWRHRLAGSLSGGQQRTLEIARMLVTDPDVLLVDEPTAGLAPVVAAQVYQELARLKAEGHTILLVDQNVRAAVALADYVYTLQFGRNHLEGERGEFQGKLNDLVKEWLRV
jgi:branched-chain amino acid transport system ATP-binding protein